MSRPLINTQSSSEAEVVFYEAFMHCDVDVMSALWAEGDVVCVHPGSGIISGYEAVVRSWRHILENSSPSEIRYDLVSKTIAGDLAIHIVTEEILNNGTPVAIVVATNVYRRFNHGWQMVEHHGSVMQQEAVHRTLQ
jgi:hypothetical protein